MEIIRRIKKIDIRTIIESETKKKFNSRSTLSECPFCKSGSGKNHTSAFSVTVKENYFKCFSCDAKGSAIDFILNQNQVWNDREAIKYLADKYLTDIPKPPLKSNLNQFEKTIYAIKCNNIRKATDYLKQRHVNIKLLPKHSYYYDSLQHAVVFLDSDEKLINKRFIEQKNDSPKALNKGQLNESIYSALYKPDLDTLYIHEGVINALSMPEHSSIAIFSIGIPHAAPVPTIFADVTIIVPALCFINFGDRSSNRKIQ